jgi:hypothetical protein
MTATSMSPCLANLAPHRIEDVERRALSAMGNPAVTIVAGKIGALGFVATEDPSDGQIEISVSVSSGRATPAHVAALCRKMQIDPPQDTFRIRGGGLMWVHRMGATA